MQIVNKCKSFFSICKIKLGKILTGRKKNYDMVLKQNIMRNFTMCKLQNVLFIILYEDIGICQQ